MQKLSIEETKEFMAFVYALITAGVEISEDNKYNLKDIPSVFPVIKSSIKAFGGREKIIAEMLNIDEAEKQELIDQAKEALGLLDEKYMPYIVRVMKLGLDYFELHLDFLEIKNAA